MIDFLGKASSKVLPDPPAKSFYLCAVDSLDVLPGAIGPSQTMEGAIAFFVGCAYPSDEFADKCHHWIAASVGNSERVVRAKIKARGAG